jgi:hypothetical protein
MPSFLTVEQAVQHLRLDSDFADVEANRTEIEEMVEAASGAVINYLKTSAYFDRDDNLKVNSRGQYSAPPVVFTATKIMLGYLWKDRDNDAAHEYEQGYLPRPVTALLFPLRDPAVS